MAVLGRSEIRRRLEGELGDAEIFQAGTWSEDSLRGASYNLRIAGDYLILPDGTRYWDGSPDGHKKCSKPFWLRPGDVAFVSSVEELCMPLGLSGNIAPRFRRALEGILVMGGMLVDPGYRGRLHFQLANLGNEPFRIKPGVTSVAAIQLLPVEGQAGSERIPTSHDLLEQIFESGASGPHAPLRFFSRVEELRTDIARVQDDGAEDRVKLEATKRSTEQLLVFGVFLVSITLFTVAIGALIDALAGSGLKDASKTAANVEFTFPGLVLGAALLVIVAVACVYMMKPVMRMVEKDRDEEQAQAAEMARRQLARTVDAE